jgi:hypothetical protein
MTWGYGLPQGSFWCKLITKPFLDARLVRGGGQERTEPVRASRFRRLNGVAGGSRTG